jgi:hypothetical protein
VIQTLVRASAAFVGAGTPTGAEHERLAASLARMTGALAARERRLLRLGLFVLDLRSLASGLATFRKLPDARARAVLDALGGSRIAALRRLHQSLRMMTQLAWYADPAHWAECGYDGPWLGRVDVERGPPPDLGPVTAG